MASSGGRWRLRGGLRLSTLWPLAAYFVLVMALFVRFVDPDERRPPRDLVATPEHLGIVRRHHRFFYAILFAAPCEWWLRGRPGGDGAPPLRE